MNSLGLDFGDQQDAADRNGIYLYRNLGGPNGPTLAQGKRLHEEHSPWRFTSLCVTDPAQDGRRAVLTGVQHLIQEAPGSRSWRTRCQIWRFERVEP